jgi:ornithine carbamoyltransferase
MEALRNPIAMSAMLRAPGADPRESWSGEKESAMLANARLLRDATGAGQAHMLLRDKFIGLLAEDDADEKAELFKSAALALGARVAHIQPNLTERSDPRVLRETAHMLGRLYDAIECQGQPSALVARLREATAVPVFEELSSPTPLTDGLAERLGVGSGLEGRRFVVQVVLISTLR